MNRVRMQIGAMDASVLPYTGKGICVAVLDSGVSNHSDLQGRIKLFHNFLNPQADYSEPFDDYGHGTQVSYRLDIRI